MRAERLTDSVAHHAEGPCWWPGWGGLRWVDMTAGDVLALAPDGAITRAHVGDVAAMIRPRAAGGAVIAVERGLAFADEGWRVDPLRPMWTTDTIRMNEGGVAPDGSLYVGSMAYDQAKGAARLHRVRPGGEVETALESVTVSNGIDFSPDGTRAYYNDTPTGQIALFDWSPQEGLTGRRVLAEVDGNPDGLTVDGEGGDLGGDLRRQPGGALVPRRDARCGDRRRGTAGDGVHLRRRGPRGAVHHDLPGGARGGRGPCCRFALRREAGRTGEVGHALCGVRRWFRDGRCATSSTNEG